MITLEALAWGLKLYCGIVVSAMLILLSMDTSDIIQEDPNDEI